MGVKCSKCHIPKSYYYNNNHAARKSCREHLIDVNTNYCLHCKSKYNNYNGLCYHYWDFHFLYCF